MTKHYNARAAEPRHKTGITVLQSAWDYVKRCAKAWSLTKNAALERIVVEHEAGVMTEVYGDVIDTETDKRQKAKVLREIERLIREIAEMEGDGE